MERVAAELSRRGHRVLVLAPSRSQERVRASRKALRAARGGPQGAASLLEGTDRRHATRDRRRRGARLPGPTGAAGGSRRRPSALPIDVARTVEELLSTVQLDFVHVHEPFAPSTSNAALRHSRALNVGSFHSSTERLLSTLVARRFVESFFGRLDARTASLPATAELMSRHFPGDYRLVPDDDDAAEELEQIYRELAARRHSRGGRPRAAPAAVDAAADRRRPAHAHRPLRRLRHAGRGAAGERARAGPGRDRGDRPQRDLRCAGGPGAGGQIGPAAVKVIVGEEVKTAGEGEVIGLFIKEKIPRGLSLQETVAEIKRQGGIVYVPHPFDRMHSVPDYEHLLKILDEVDAIEVFNPRVAISAFNEEAVRFAAKYRILAGRRLGLPRRPGARLGAHPDARLRRAGEFLQSLRDAEILTRPSSLLYVQALKFLQTRATPRSARRASKARRLKRLEPGPRRRRAESERDRKRNY